MLWIGFQVGDARYAMRARCVVEVLPRLPLRPVALAPVSVVGLFTYHGRATPVIDLGLLLRSAPAVDRLSSRILVVELRRAGESRTVGLLAEKVMEVREERESPQPALNVEEAPFLGGVLVQGGELTQAIEPEGLIPPELWRVLFPPEAEP